MSPRTTAVIEVIARDRASSVLRNIGSSIQRVGEIAAGVAIARAMEQGIRSAIGLARAGVNVASSYMLVERGMAALLAMQKMYTTAQWEEVRVGTQVRKLTAEEAKERDKLMASLAKHRAQLEVLTWRQKEAQMRVIQMTQKYGEAGIATNKWRAIAEKLGVDIENLRAKIAEESAELARLNALEGKQIAVTKRVMRPTTSYSEALSLVRDDVAAVWDETRRLAIMRGVPASVIASAYQYGFAVGMPLETLKELVPGMVDFAVATGKTEPEMKRMVKVMGDIASRGRLAAQEIYQLANVNIPILDLLADKLGTTREEIMDMVEKGAIPAELVFETLSGFFSLTSQAAEEMSGTFPILVGSIKEMLRLGLYEFFAPVLDVLGEIIRYIRDMALEFGVFDRLRDKGKALADKLGAVRDRVKEIFDQFREGKTPSEILLGILEDLGLNIRPETLEEARRLWENLKETFSDIADVIETRVGQALGLMNGELGTLDQRIAWINDHWEKFDAAIKGIAWATIISLAVRVILGVLRRLDVRLMALAGLISLVSYLWETKQETMILWVMRLEEFFTYAFWRMRLEAGKWWAAWGPIFEAAWGWLNQIYTAFSTATSAIWAHNSAWDRLAYTLGLATPFLMIVPVPILKIASALGVLIGWLSSSARVTKWLRDRFDNLYQICEKIADRVTTWAERWHPFERVLEGLIDLADDLASKIEDVLRKLGILRQADLGPFQWGSPSPFEMSVRGVTDALHELSATMRGLRLAPAYAMTATAPSGPTYNVVVHISGGTPESARDAAYEAVLAAFQELEAQLRV